MEPDPRRRALVPTARAYIRFGPGLGRSAAWRVLDRTGIPRRALRFSARTQHGVQMTGDQRWIMHRCIYWFGIWEPLLTRWIANSLQPGDDFVDVGANVGYFSLLAARCVGPAGSVLALEPSPLTRAKLREHVTANGAPNIRVLAAAAAAEAGRIPLYRAPWNDAESSTVAREGLELEAEVTAAPLSGLIEQRDLSSLRLVKVDVEGAEVGVLEGLRPVLRRARAAEVVIEVHPDSLAEQGSSVDDLIGMAAADGLAPYWLPVDFSEKAHVRPLELSRPIPGEPPGDKLAHLILSRRSGGPAPLA